MKKENSVVNEAAQFQVGHIRIEKEEKEMRKTAFDLEGVVTSISLRTETLDDISTNLKHLQGSMDQAVFNGTENISFPEHHREVRILAELMYYTVNELVKNHAEAEELSKDLLSKVKNQPTDVERSWEVTENEK